MNPSPADRHFVAPPTGSAATDTANIQAALTAAGTAGGGVVKLHPGTYKLNLTARMTQPGPADAKARALVVLPDGRTGRLLWAPAAARSDRTRALVVVDGRHVHVAVTELRVAP